MAKLVLRGAPLSTGSIYRSSCRGNYPTMYMTPKGKDHKISYRKQAREQWDQEVLTRAVEVEVRLFFPRKGKHDLDNYMKILLDCLSGVVYADDSQIERLTITKTVDKTNPRTEVYIL